MKEQLELQLVIEKPTKKNEDKLKELIRKLDFILFKLDNKK